MKKCLLLLMAVAIVFAIAIASTGVVSAEPAVRGSGGYSLNPPESPNCPRPQPNIETMSIPVQASQGLDKALDYNPAIGE